MKLIFDLGAHWGESIRYFSKKLKDVSSFDIISVEAGELNFKKLQKNSQKYKDSFNKITLHNKFVYHESKDISFYEYIDDFHSAGSTYSKEKFEFNSEKRLEYANLPHNIIHPDIFNICEEYKKSLDLYEEVIIKMDIEGAEYEILPDLIKILDPEKTKYFFLEFHSDKLGISPSVDQNFINNLRALNIQTKELNNIK